MQESVKGRVTATVITLSVFVAEEMTSPVTVRIKAKVTAHVYLNLYLYLCTHL